MNFPAPAALDDSNADGSTPPELCSSVENPLGYYVNDPVQLVLRAIASSHIITQVRIVLLDP